MELPEGKPLNLEEAELFIKSRKERESFNGVLQMHGRTDEREYTIELLMYSGEVVAIEFGEKGKKTPLQAKTALEEVKNLGGSEGDLKLLKFNEGEMDKAIGRNADAILEKRVILEDFKIRIKPVAPKQAPGKRSMFGAVKGLFGAPTAMPKREFKGKFKLEFSESKKEKHELGEGLEPQKEKFDVKKTLMSRIKGRRFERLTRKLATKKRGKEKPGEKKLIDGKMVETKIDTLFNLVDKRSKLKINEKLAKELGVSKARIEEWAVILEEHNLVTINYPAIGEPEITKRGKK